MGGVWNVLSLEQMRQLSDEQITVHVNERLAPDAGMGNQFFAQPADFLAAQFYVSELNRRENRRANAERDRIETRRHRIDMAIDVLIVLLIGVEIFLGISAGRQQSKQAAQELKAFGDMQSVMSDLQKSSQATAASLDALRGTTESMNAAVQKQLGLFYDVSVNVVVDSQTKELTLVNNGRTEVSVWGGVIGNVPANFDKEGRIIVPETGYKIDATKECDFVIARFPHPTDGQVPSEFYFKNARGQEFVQYGYFGVHWNNVLPTITTQTTYIVPENWSTRNKKRATAATVPPISR